MQLQRTSKARKENDDFAIGLLKRKTLNFLPFYDYDHMSWDELQIPLPICTVCCKDHNRKPCVFLWPQFEFSPHVLLKPGFS